MSKIQAMLTKQGDPIPKTAICDSHWSRSYREIRRHASFIKDWDGIDFVDVTGSPELVCVVCGVPEGGPS